MKNVFLATLLTVDVSTAAFASPPVQYPVPLVVSEVKVERVGDMLFRYVEFFEDYPCIRFETIQPIAHKLIERIEACTFKIDGQSIDVRTKNLAGVGYKDYRLEGNVFHFVADIVPGGSGPGIPPLKCTIVISEKGKLSQPACVSTDSPSE